MKCSEAISKAGWIAPERYYENLKDAVQFFSTEMGFHLVPVIPVAGLFLRNGKDQANGKAPSRWTKTGEPVLLNTSQRHHYRPNHLEQEPSTRLLEAIDTAAAKGLPIGLGTHGREDVAILDFDSKHFGADENGKATDAAKQLCSEFIQQWRKDHKLENTYAETSPTGGWHVWVALRSQDTRVNFKIEGAVDVDGKPIDHIGEVLWPGGHCVIAPTKRVDGVYKPNGLLKFETLGSLADVGVVFTGQRPEDLEDVEVACEELEDALKELRQPVGTEKVPTLSKLLRGMSRDLYGGSWKTDERFFKEGTKQPDRSRVITIVLNEAFSWYRWLAHNALPFVDDLNESDGVTVGTGIQRFVAELEAEDKWQRVLDSVVRNIGRLSLLHKNYSDANARADYRRSCLSHKGREAICPKDVETRAMLVEWLTAHYGNRLKFNELTKLVELDGEPLRDPELLYIQLEIDHGIQGVSRQPAMDAYSIAGKRTTYNPVQDYLNAVRTQLLPCRGPAEGVELIPVYEIGSRYFAVKDPFQSMLLGKHLMAAATRAFQPGVPYQQCLVLRGDQGVGKSTGIKALAPTSDMYASSEALPNDKDLLMVLCSYWLYEFEEIDRLTAKRTASELKALISRSEDVFRPPYGSRTATWKRISVLWGTTNQDQFLIDATGERRWWVCDVEGPIDVERIRVDRDLIWASVMHATDQGEDFRLSPDQYQQSAENASTASKESLLTDQVEAYLGRKPWITEVAVISDVLHLDQDEYARTGPKAGVIAEVCDALRRLGWTRSKQPIRDLAGRPNTRGVWFAPGIDHTRSGPRLLKMFKDRSLTVPSWSEQLKQLMFTSHLGITDGIDHTSLDQKEWEDAA